MELAFTVFTIFMGLLCLGGLFWISSSIRRRIDAHRERSEAEARLIAEAQMHIHYDNWGPH